MADLQRPARKSIFFKDGTTYACLASHPIAKGHAIVAWSKRVRDLHSLSRAEYEHLMDVVDAVRDAMLKTLRIKKVYLLYMDEVEHVHWHLIPRYDEQGMNMLAEKPKRCTDFRLAHRYAAQLRAFERLIR